MFRISSESAVLIIARARRTVPLPTLISGEMTGVYGNL